MKKILSLMMIPLILSACGNSGEYIHSTEPRSHVYYGQPVADLYENFGTPTRGIKYSADRRALIYHSQEIEKEWAYRYFRECVLTFYLENDRVVDWSAEGNKCVINGENGSAFKSAKGQSEIPVDAFGGSYREGSEGGTNTRFKTAYGEVPADAFGSEYSSSDPAADSWENSGVVEEFGLLDRPTGMPRSKRDSFEETGRVASKRSLSTPYGKVPADAFGSGYSSSTSAANSWENSGVVEEFGLLDRSAGRSSSSQTVSGAPRVIPATHIKDSGRYTHQIPADAF